MSFYRYGVAALALMVGPAFAQADADAVGRIKNLSGKATVTTQGNVVSATVGTPVFQGSVIQTEKGASLGLTFKDNSVISLGSDTRLTVDDYVYNPTQGQYKFGASMGKGAMNYLSGAMAKARPESVAIKAQGAVIGVRGTNLVIKDDSATEDAPAAQAPTAAASQPTRP